MRKILTVLSLLALVVFTSCLSKKEEHEGHPETRFLVTSPMKKDTTTNKEYVCQIHSIRNIEVRALERGYLQKILVDEGQFVKEGQLLFKVMPQIYEAEVLRAKAEAKVAEIEYQNTKLLADSDVVSQNELAMAKAKYEKANAELELAQVHLGFCEIRAPFDGIIDRLKVRQGSLVEEGELLTTLSDNSKMWVYFNVAEPEYLDYQTNKQEGQKTKVQLQMANNQIFDQPGVVETVEAEFNNETGNIPFRATFRNPNGLLRHGQTGKILMPVPFRDAIIIPQKATFEILDKKYVFIVDEEDRIHMRPIRIGAEMSDLYVIAEGLEAEEKFLLEGLRKVKEDQEIVYDFKEPEKVLAQLQLPAE
jgi:membrane fusion protein (multidrug efflux system)